jgi:hypothetical protein
VAGAQDAPHPVAAALLLDHRRDDQVAATLDADLGHGRGGDQHGGQAALHVAGAATPHSAVGDGGRERVVAPGLGPVDRHDVDVAVQVERAAAAAAGEPADDRAAAVVRQVRIAGRGVGEGRLGVRLDPLHGQPGGAQMLLDDGLGGLLVTEQRGTADELGSELDELFAAPSDGGAEGVGRGHGATVRPIGHAPRGQLASQARSRGAARRASTP